MNGSICVLGQTVTLPVIKNGKPMLVAPSIVVTNLCKEIILPMFPSKSKYQFSRARWYEAKLPRDRQGAFNWCVKNFGPEPKYPDAWSRWYFNVERTFRFRDEKDYVFFMLRWL